MHYILWYTWTAVCSMLPPLFTTAPLKVQRPQQVYSSVYYYILLFQKTALYPPPSHGNKCCVHDHCFERSIRHETCWNGSGTPHIAQPNPYRSNSCLHLLIFYNFFWYFYYFLASLEAGSRYIWCPAEENVCTLVARHIPCILQHTQCIYRVFDHQICII